MSLPPVVSDPEVCPNHVECIAHDQGHDWGDRWVLRPGLYCIEVCCYCGGRKPNDLG